MATNLEIHTKAAEGVKAIPKMGLETSKGRWRQAFIATAEIFNPKSKFTNVFVRSTWDQVGEVIQKVTGPLVENPNLKPLITEYLTRLYRHLGKPNRDSVVQTWHLPSIANIILAEVKLSDGSYQLCWFKLGI